MTRAQLPRGLPWGQAGRQGGYSPVSLALCVMPAMGMKRPLKDRAQRVGATRQMDTGWYGVRCE